MEKTMRENVCDNDKVIQINNLCKSYDGFVMKNMNLDVTQGCIHGFIGQNGAGKTTTIKAVLNMIECTEGEIRVFGLDHIRSECEIKEQIGVVFDEMGFHDYMTPVQIDKMMAGVYKNWESDTFYQFLERFGLPKKRACGKFSRGMRMKLQIAVALSHRAKLLIMDEPTSGLDPVVRNEILDIFQEFIEKEDHSVFLSSHILSDLERIADEITFLDKGKVLLSGNKDDMLISHGMIKCSKEQAEQIQKEDIVFQQKSTYGCEILVRDRQLCAAKYEGLLIEPVTLEQIMLFYIQRENSGMRGEREAL